MEHERFNLTSLVPNLQNTEEYFDTIVNEAHIGRRIIRLMLIFIAFTFFYGIVMGAYSGALQAITAGVKVPLLFLVSLVICYPAFFLLQFILGSKMKLSQMTAVIMAGFVLAGGIMVSFTPIVVFFVLTGGNYHFLQLLHVAIFTLAGLFGMKMVVDALTYSCDRKNIYPKTGVVVFRFWVVILAFVSVQLAWNLRPFLAERDKPYALFRSYEGNFYTAVIYSFEQLVRPASEFQKQHGTTNQTPMFFDTTKER